MTTANTTAKDNAATTKKKGRKAKKRVCAFCTDNIDKIDYKDVARLRKYITCLLYTSPSPRDS